jgi:mRNA interferase MazF
MEQTNARLKQKEIYLVPFPFSNLSNKKVRPVLILSNNDYNKKSQDIIVCAITRNLDSKYSKSIHEKDLSEGQILENSFVKYQNICFIDKALFIKKIAKISNSYFEDIKSKIIELLN